MLEPRRPGSSPSVREGRPVGRGSKTARRVCCSAAPRRSTASTRAAATPARSRDRDPAGVGGFDALYVMDHSADPRSAGLGQLPGELHDLGYWPVHARDSSARWSRRHVPNVGHLGKISPPRRLIVDGRSAARAALFSRSMAYGCPSRPIGALRPARGPLRSRQLWGPVTPLHRAGCPCPHDLLPAAAPPGRRAGGGANGGPCGSRPVYRRGQRAGRLRPSAETGVLLLHCAAAGRDPIELTHLSTR